MIFLSTGGERRQKGSETALQYFQNGIECIELSGGVYSPTCTSDLVALPSAIKLQVHNYFPPPEIPFVFNLASIDTDVSTRSLDHVRQAIRLAVQLERPIYSFHAGFRIDPSPRELGTQLAMHNLLSRESALEIFGDRVASLAEEARREGVTLLVENNVISKTNLQVYGDDPLLLTHPDEIFWFMERMPDNVSLLLDVAHLKVSAKTREFDMIAAHEMLKKWIKGYHLSDNDGSADTNNSVTEQSWFWNYILRDLNYYTLEVYGLPISKMLQQRALTGRMLSSPVQSETSFE